jgi:hypothetical protein
MLASTLQLQRVDACMTQQTVPHHWHAAISCKHCRPLDMLLLSAISSAGPGFGTNSSHVTT